MTDIFKKLNLKDVQEILVLNAPQSFEPEIAALQGVRVMRKLAQVEQVHFSLTFVIQQQELDELSRSVTAKAVGDALIWFAYPKKSSKRYQSQINRDAGWEALGAAGFEPVRQVAIDEDWSALRFRRVEYIQSMQRDQRRALSQQGKDRVSKD